MSKTRVPKGEKYWFINENFDSEYDYEQYALCDDSRFDLGNYFTDEKEAERVANLLRAVLKGAEVIEMPSEEEIEAYKKTLNTPHTPGCDYMERVVTDTANYSYLRGFQLGINWLKSKIVK